MARHIKKLKITAFRGIKDLKVDEFADINILVGGNNCGKTSLLEILKILSQPQDIGGLIKVALSRKNRTKKNEFIDTVLTVFKKEVPDKQENNNMRDSYWIQAEAEVNDKQVGIEIFADLTKQLNFLSDDESDNEDSILEGALKVTNGEYKNTDRFAIDSRARITVDDTEEIYNSVFMPVNVNIYGGCVNLLQQVIKTEKKDIFIKVLKIFDKDIKDISLVEDMIWIHHGKKSTMPLFSYGTGMQKALLMSVALVMAKDGVLLIDEIETAIHTSALDEVFSFLIKASKTLNVQLFATTHSIESVDKFLECSKHNLNNIRVITLYKNTDKTVARVLDGKKAIELKDELGLELR